MRVIIIPEVGEVELRKSKRAKRVILKISPTGSPIVTLPYFAPYKVGEAFARANVPWLEKNLKEHQQILLEPGKSLGKDHVLIFKVSLTSQSPRSIVSKNTITVTYPASQNFDSPIVQAQAKKAAIRALRRQAEKYLPPLVHKLAKLNGYEYREVRIKAGFTRWGSCSSNRILNLSIWLMQLPDNLVEYVICHELTHLNHMNHSASFWQELEAMVPEYKACRKQLRQYRPTVL